MSITAAELLVMVKAEGASNVELSLAAVSAAIIGAGVESVKMAADFQQSMNRLKTGAGDTTDNLAKLGDGILRISTDTGVMSKPLTDAMYLIVSSGQRGAQALDTLSVAAKGAVIEQAKVADVANVLSGVMTNYGTKTFNATQYMNGLIVAVQHGKITLQELAVAMGPIDPIAHDLGIHFQDVAAAMTTQTNAMVPAARAATGLRFMMLALENPTKKATDAMSAMGLNSVDVANKMKKSLPDALQMIYNAAKKAGPEGSVPFDRAIADMVGGIRSFTAFTALTGPHMKDFAKNTQLIGDAMKKSAKEVLGWDVAQKNFNVQLDKAAAAVNALMIDVGTALLPVLGQLFQAVTPNLAAFKDWIDKSNILGNVAKTLSGWIGYVGDAFQQVFNRGNDMVDTFDRASSTIGHLGNGFQEIINPVSQVMYTLDQGQTIISGFTQATKPMVDSFDRAKGVIAATTKVTKPMVDSFDRATDVIKKTHKEVKDAPNVWLPFWTAVKRVRDAFMAIDWKAVGAGFERIRVAISKMDWGKVGAVFSDIATAISKIDWGNVAKNFERITIALAKVDWGTVGKNISTIVSTLSQVDWGTVAQGITSAIQGIRNLVGWFTWAYNLLLGHSIIPDIINGIVKWFASLPGKVMGSIISLIGQIGASFNRLISSAFDWGQTFVQNIVNGIKSVSGNISATLHGMHIPGFASGTDSAPGGMAVVGERGPELMYVPQGAQIIPNNKIGQMSSHASSGQPVQININIAGHRVGQVLLPELVQAIRYGVGGVQ